MEVILTPIENAIDLIVTQTAKVKAELDILPVRLHPLQQTLQGSVVPMVNPGPIRICETFLSTSAIQNCTYDLHYVQELIYVMRDFMRKCDFAVRFNDRMTARNDKYEKFTKMINSHYSELKMIISKACDDAEKVLIATRQLLTSSNALAAKR
eukprot:TRINITY_DN11035_c0_g1_i2.p1 TRINITY_DN11035_c0_g1~~TRINITY_DN11035_c0_g1_i2.p1  ORF type:complete len:169 (-),score=46.46 TRINITY_DN11035_c0_g1_i2:268-726(-)